MPPVRKKPSSSRPKKTRKPVKNSGPKRSPRKRGNVDSIGQLKKAFLAAYRNTGNIRAAAEAAGVSRQTHYNWISADPSYVTAFEDAGEDAADALEHVARHRATVGYRDKPPSDTLLIFLLKGLRPQRYRERYEVGGLEDGKPFEIRLVREGINGQVHELDNYDETVGDWPVPEPQTDQAASRAAAAPTPSSRTQVDPKCARCGRPSLDVSTG